MFQHWRQLGSETEVPTDGRAPLSFWKAPLDRGRTEQRNHAENKEGILPAKMFRHKSGYNSADGAAERCAADMTS